MYSHPDAGPYYAQLNHTLRDAVQCLTRTEQLRKAYAARRDEIDLRTDADLHYPRERREPDLADLIATHSVHIAPYGAIVYARIGEREVGVKYSATGGDKAKAVRLAVREVLRLVGVVS